MKQNRLNSLEIQSSLQLLNKSSIRPWTVCQGKLHKTFVFKNFSKAWCFMTESAILSEKVNHHPELYNSYKRVDIDLMTHHINGLSELDFFMATEIEKINQS